MTKSKIKVCYVLSYRSPDYIRTRVLLSALDQITEVELSKAINSSKSVWRYAQTIYKLLFLRLTKRPNVYILGFRGQEIFWPVRLLTIGKPLIFDEFINMHDWLGEENNKLPKFFIKLADRYEQLALKSCRLILADTNLGAQSSSRTYYQPLTKYRTIYVGADESLFHPSQATRRDGDKLQVFFYGNMAPLHGLHYILEAAKILKDETINFLIIGGRGKPNSITSITNFIKSHSLTNVDYRDWADFNEIAQLINQSDIFLGGPFGNTSQAKRVITGKTFQALAAGKATVVGKIDENIDFVDKANCLLVGQGSAKAIAEAILWASQNRNQLSKIGLAGAELYRRQFGQAVITKKLQLIVDETITK